MLPRFRSLEFIEAVLLIYHLSWQVHVEAAFGGLWQVLSTHEPGPHGIVMSRRVYNVFVIVREVAHIQVAYLQLLSA